MKTTTKIQVIGGAVGLALFVALGLLMTVAASKPLGPSMKPGPIDPKVVAPAEELGKAYAMVAAHVRPAVVSVYSEKVVKFREMPFPFGDEFFRQFFGGQFPQPQTPPREYKQFQRGMGSGMILDRDGHILTNYHVVKDVDEISVQLADKRKFEAEIVGTDPRTDIAVIKLKGRLPDNLPTVALGDSDALEVGDLVVAIGAPFGLTQTVTTGIISAKGRADVGITDYEDFLQTDTPINPGNSGGPLVNMRGEVIGMNSAIATSVGQFAGVGFAIPSNMIRTLLPRLIKGETITRGQLGVVIQEVTRDLARQFGLSEPKGALVAQVTKDSPAEKAGIKVGDVILHYDGREVADTRSLRNEVAATAPGTQVNIELLRHGKTETVTATIGKLEEPTTTAAAPSKETQSQLTKLGLTVQTLTPDLAKQFNLEADKGVVITDVEAGSVASLANLQQGDVIVEADRQPVSRVADLERILAKAKDKDNLLLLVNHQGTTVFVVLQMHGAQIGGE
jgi:serine protease Do